jgi:hypothetical protein
MDCCIPSELVTACASTIATEPHRNSSKDNTWAKVPSSVEIILGPSRIAKIESETFPSEKPLNLKNQSASDNLDLGVILELSCQNIQLEN